MDRRSRLGLAALSAPLLLGGALSGCVGTGAGGRSIKVRVPKAAAALDAVGTRVALLELEGMLFFGTAGELADRVRQLAQRVDYMVLGMRRINDIDSTGARTLLELAADLDHAGKVLIVADLREHDTRMQSIRAMGGRGPVAVPQGPR